MPVRNTFITRPASHVCRWSRCWQAVPASCVASGWSRCCSKLSHRSWCWPWMPISSWRQPWRAPLPACVSSHRPSRPKGMRWGMWRVMQAWCITSSAQPLVRRKQRVRPRACVSMAGQLDKPGVLCSGCRLCRQRWHRCRSGWTSPRSALDCPMRFYARAWSRRSSKLMSSALSNRQQ
ncbi:hypothetical protein D3C72_859180 [compost metagenome]